MMADVTRRDAARRYSICPADTALLVLLFSTPFTSQYVAQSLPVASFITGDFFIFICAVSLYTLQPVEMFFVSCCELVLFTEKYKCVLCGSV
jgi:hypothetical protein